MNRRSFLETGVQLSLGAVNMPYAFQTNSCNRSKKSANEKIVFGVIGCNNMGGELMKLAVTEPNMECGAICDLDEDVAAKNAQQAFQASGKKPRLMTDYRKMLDNQDIDAVFIATPDHWHCLPFVDACQAGKEIYVEKPLANSIGECDLMVKATRKFQRIVQVGQQQRSGSAWQEAISLIQSGAIGQLRKVNCWANFNYALGGKKVPDSNPSNSIHFDSWLGPAPQRTYNINRHHGSWRLFWDYGGGLMTDWGAHLLDIALWAKNITTAPGAVVSSGGNFFSQDYDHETFDTLNVLYQLPDYSISWEQLAGIETGYYGRSYGLAFVCNNATLVIDRSGWELYEEVDNKISTSVLRKSSQKSGESHLTHIQNWIACMRDRKDPTCTVENARLVALYAHMGNIALRTNSKLVWDERRHCFLQNEKANSLIMPEYRMPWTLPKL